MYGFVSMWVRGCACVCKSSYVGKGFCACVYGFVSMCVWIYVYLCNGLYVCV